MESLLASGDDAELRRRFGARLAFGTAGMRGPVGAGPMRMNRVLVRVVAAAVAERAVRDGPADPHVVVGCDARHRSHDFASDAARVLAARGVRVTKLAGPRPTPLLAFAVRHLSASAGMMITASHNPRSDNGCKVFWRGGAQLAAPIDEEISRIIDRTPLAAIADHSLAPDGGPLAAIAGRSLAPDGQPPITTDGGGLEEAYVAAAVGLLTPDGPRSARIAYTPLHGVGAETFLRAAAAAGFEAPRVVAEQAEPDPDFPAAPFPNPEEAGVLDGLLRLAARSGADVALAHDPDADRLAAAVPYKGRWRLLTGDELGCLLAEHLLSRPARTPSPPEDPHQRTPLRRKASTDHPRQNTTPNQRKASTDHPRQHTTPNRHKAPPEDRRHTPPTPLRDEGRRRLVISTVVSSRLLGKIAARHDADWAETLTGFKWIMKARRQKAGTHDLVLAYEDALGYAAGDAVLDKDGISAALVMAELVSGLAAEGRTAADLLDEQHRRHGVHATGQRSIRFEALSDSGSLRRAAMDALRKAPPAELGGRPVSGVVDLASGEAAFPPADVLVFQLEGERVAVRPSGTEPKLKVYAESVAAPAAAEGGLRRARVEARARVAALLDDAVRLASDPERLLISDSEAKAGAEAPAGTEAPADGAGSALSTRTAGTPGGAVRQTASLVTHPPRRADPTVRRAEAVRRADVLRLIVKCVDLTTLEGDDTPGRIRALCAQALRPDPADPTVGSVAAVCVYPLFAGLASEILAGTPVAVAAVAGAFPSGLSPLAVRAAEVRAAVDAGAAEIDTVLNRSAFLSGRRDQAASELRALRRAAGGARLKVILEVGELASPAAIADASRLAMSAGADMIKTSTGKSAAGGATTAAVRTMAEAVADHAARTGRPVGIKVSGGLRAAADAESYVAVVRSVLGDDWLTPERLRFGASGLLNAVTAALVSEEA